MTAGRLPNLVIAGVAKAGTTSLFAYLAQHPDVCPADEKELYYFSAPRFGEPLGPLPEYAAHFAHCGEQRYVMEATPGYFFGGQPTITAMQRILPEPRVLLCLRDPVSRFASYYAFHLTQGHLDADLTPASYLAACRRLRADGSDRQREHVAYWGLSGGCYAEAIDEWLDAFGDRLLVVLFEDFVADPRRTLRQICAWADVSTGPVESIDVSAINRTARFRSPLLRVAQLQLRRRGAGLRGRAPALYAAAAKGYRALNATSRGIPKLEDETRDELADFYRDSSQRTARSLRAHGYDDLPAWLAGP